MLVVEAELSRSCYQDDSFIKKIVIRWEQRNNHVGVFQSCFYLCFKRVFEEINFFKIFLDISYHLDIKNKF